MFPDEEYAGITSPFNHPVPLPDVDPGVAPTLTLSINCEWLPVIRAALQALYLQETWATDDPAVLTLVQMRAMTLASLFVDCGEELLPVACPYDFFNDESEDGWLAWNGACVIPTANWVGAGWTSNSTSSGGCSPHYNQLSIARQVDAHVVAVRCLITTVSNVVLDVFARTSAFPPSGGATHLGHASAGPGVGFEIEILCDSDVTQLQIVLNNDPTDGSVDTQIAVHKIEVDYHTPGGFCPP